jgi:uncharacterized membrane protein
MLLPLGILTTAVIADLGALSSGLSLFGMVAQADLLTGILAGVVALAAVLVDLLTAPPGSRTRQALSVVGVAYGAMLAMFAGVWSVRALSGPIGSVGSFLFELLALAAGVVAVKLARGLALGHSLPDLQQLGQRLRLFVDQWGQARREVPPRLPPRFSSSSSDPEATVVLFGLSSPMRDAAVHRGL